MHTPSHGLFEMYDILVAVYRVKDDGPQLIGLQLKQGKEIPSKGPREGIVSYLIRGKAALKRGVNNGWISPSQDETESFLGGISGENWLPKRWPELTTRLGKNGIERRGSRLHTSTPNIKKRSTLKSENNLICCYSYIYGLRVVLCVSNASKYYNKSLSIRVRVRVMSRSNWPKWRMHSLQSCWTRQ